jgi:YVTN family beta-propeller protein
LISMRTIHLIAAAFALVAFRPSPAAAQEAPAGTILVANMDDDSVWLIDAVTGERRAMVRTHIAPHEVAVSRSGAWAAITNYGDERGPGNLVQFVDVASGNVTHEIRIEGYERLHGASFLEGDSLLALTSERTGQILVVAVSDGAIRRTLETGGRTPHMAALGGDWIYAANMSDGTVSRIDPSGDSPPNVWAAGTRTEGIAATPDGREGWTGSMDAGSVIGIDGASGEVIARIEGLAVPYRLAVTSDGETVVVTDPGAGHVVLVDRAARSVVASIDVNAAAEAQGYSGDASPQGFTLSPDGQWAFVSAKGINRVAIVHLPSRRVVRFVESGMGPDGISFSRVH